MHLIKPGGTGTSGNTSPIESECEKPWIWWTGRWNSPSETQWRACHPRTSFQVTHIGLGTGLQDGNRAICSHHLGDSFWVFGTVKHHENLRCISGWTYESPCGIIFEVNRHMPFVVRLEPVTPWQGNQMESPWSSHQAQPKPRMPLFHAISWLALPSRSLSQQEFAYFPASNWWFPCPMNYPRRPYFSIQVFICGRGQHALRIQILAHRIIF